MKMKENIKILALFFILITFCKSQKNKCNMKETCGACIRDSNCVWCNAPFSENSKLQRCEYFSVSEQNSNWCDAENIINPQSKRETLQNLPLQSSTTAGKEAVQIAPQRVKLALRPGQEYELKFKYATAKDYPVDLYYIMDLSASMAVHKKKLSELGNLLSNTMKKLTKSFRLGFGSFVDKVEMPYTFTDPKSLKNPCPSIKGGCAPPYSFKNHLPLADDANKFTNEVREAKESGNSDFPEGGFDALMQAIVCQKDIGWRSKARRLIVFSTDADFHIAGDGKLGGIVQPNDGKCHMNNSEYTHGNILDYPSIGQIRQTVKEHNINLIFAVTQKKLNIYNDLKNQIEGSSVGVLSNDSSNVVDLVAGVYDKIVDSVKISDNADSNIEVKYYSSCRGFTEKETNECNNLKVGAEVEFKAVIKVLSCHQNKKQIFEIKPGALDESLTVEIDTICDCDCEKQDKPSAIECHNSGSLQCGICSCNSGKFGATCQCDSINSISVEDVSNCKMSNTSEICSGLGTCKCNTCDCFKRVNKNEKIQGKFCECNNYSCQRIGGALCSNNGVCECGKCECFAGFEGEACECRNKTDTCIDNNSGEICNNHGSCNCGSCICDESYSGQFCEECLSCVGQLCESLKDCVEYNAYKTGIYNEKTYFSNCSTVPNLTLIKKIEDESSEREKICRGTDNEGCTFYFKYYYDEMDQTFLRVFAQKEKICPIKVKAAALVGGIIGSILLAGLLLLLLWKGITTVHDRREYAKFETERKNARWNRGENPLFKNPTSEFKNPTFSNENN